MESKMVIGIILALIVTISISSIISTSMILLNFNNLVETGIGEKAVAGLQEEIQSLEIECNETPNLKAIIIKVEEATFYCTIKAKESGKTGE